jgi:methylenetetrahydrofolate dehydrogenase (NADP+)/methenyltetrahydrofolate cyclohydrolase
LREIRETSSATILDGQAVAAAIKAEVAAQVGDWQTRLGIQPLLAVVRVGNDPASEIYVRGKIRSSAEVGLASEHHALAADTSEEQLLGLIAELNRRDDVDGILVQLPLPKQINETKVIDAVDPDKDVDGFHPLNVGKLGLGRPVLAPCTPAGIMEMLHHYDVPVRGARAVVVGRSNIVGRPMAQLLLQHDATVTICHSRTVDLVSVTREADILVAAIGRAGFIRGEHIKPGATVVDVGMNKATDAATARFLFGANAEKRIQAIEKRGFTLVGDVHPSEAMAIAGAFTPVPGGVGPLTIAMLMKNTMAAARDRRGLG